MQEDLAFVPNNLIKRLENINYSDETAIMKADRENASKDRFKALLEERRSNLKQVKSVRRDLDRVLISSLSIASDFREKRIAFLEEEIERNLRFLKPEERFKIEIIFNIKGEHEYAELVIGKEGHELMPPDSQNGRFIRQLISFTVMYTVNKLIGCKFLFCDEALSSADKNSLTELKPLVKELLSDGFQLVFIEHKEELYNTIERKEINLLKDEILELVTINKEEVINERS